MYKITYNPDIKGNTQNVKFSFEPPFGHLRGNAQGSMKSASSTSY